jgi:hypothetical protein
MKLLLISSALAAAAIAASSFVPGKNITQPVASLEDSLAEERQRFADQVLASIKGNEEKPAAEVFKSLQTFSGKESVKATHLIAIMQYWGEALGVSCTHCHNTNEWASEEKITKQIARDMYALRQTVNGQILQHIKGLQTPDPMINCGTCHRGKTIPAE